jgi:SulP family sulfate permease
MLKAIKRLQGQGITFAFARVRDDVRERMRIGGIDAIVGPTTIYERITDGVRAWRQQAGRDPASAATGF